MKLKNKLLYMIIMSQVTQVLFKPHGIMWAQIFFNAVCSGYWAQTFWTVYLSYLLSYSSLQVICLRKILIMSLSVKIFKSSHRLRKKKVFKETCKDPWDHAWPCPSFIWPLPSCSCIQVFPSSFTVVTFCNVSRKDHFHNRHVVKGRKLLWHTIGY